MKARLAKALQKYKDYQSRRFEPKRSVSVATVTSVERDPVTGHTTGIARATIDGIPDQNVFIGSGTGAAIGDTIRVENRGGAFSPDWILLGRVGSVAGYEGTLDIDRTMSTPTGVSLTSDAYTPVAGAGVFSSVTVTFNQNPDYESVASYDVAYFKDSEGSSTAEIVNVPHVFGEETQVAVIGSLLPNQSYSFRVRAKGYSGAVGGWTAYSAIVTATDATAPGTPTGLNAVAIDDYTLRLYWTRNTEPDFHYYVLDVSATNSTSGRLSGYPRTIGNQPEFVLGTSPGLPRYYAVKAVDTMGNESAYSSFSGPYQTENLPSDAGLFYFGPTVELVANLSSGATSMDVNYNILEAGWFVHLIAPSGTNEIVQINTSSPGGSAVSNGDGYRYNIVRGQGGTTGTAFNKGTIGHALTTSGYIQSDVREGLSDTPVIRIYEWDDPYTNIWADKSLRVALGNLSGITDPELGTLSGYGLYSDNAYLTGQIVALGGAILGSLEIDGGDIIGGGGAVVLDDAGVTIAKGSGTANAVTWKDGADVTGRINSFEISTYNYLSVSSFGDSGTEYSRVLISASPYTITNTGASIDVASGPTSSSSIQHNATAHYFERVDGSPIATFDATGLTMENGNILPAGTQDIGASGNKWENLYVKNIYADTVAGTLGGAQWQYAGNMIIDPVSASDSVVNVTNSGAGVAVLQVESNIVWHAGNMIIGTHVQAYDADLTTIAGLAKTDGNFIVGNGAAWTVESGATARASLGLTIGTHVQAWDTDLDTLAGLAKTDGNFIVGNGTAWTVESGATARTSLGLGSSDSPTFAGATINGNIVVTGNVDGVDVSAHAARHASGGGDAVDHDTLTNFVADEHVAHSGITLTAGNGLTGGGTIAANRTFAVGAGNGITVNADDVAVNQAYAFTWTGAHDFREDVQVFNPSNLTTPVLYVDQSAYAIGINRDPDPQFSLDVAGALRADYLVGPHAIQLSDAELIAHYDGPGPYETDFTGTAQGHKGQVATITGGVIYREGKFGKAVQLAEATTNLCTNPSFETNTTNWSSVNGGTWTRETTGGHYGDCCVKGVTTSTNHAWVHTVTGLTPGVTVTVSAHLRATTGGVRFYASNASYGGTVYCTAVTGSEWTRQSVQYTVGADGAARIVVSGTSGSNTFYVDAVQIEQKSYATPYCDGSLGTGHSWSGTAHASTSSRTAAWIEYDNEVIPEGSVTAMAWIRPTVITGYNMFWSVNDSVNSRNFHCGIDQSTSKLYAYNGSGYVTDPDAFTFNEWVHIAVVRDGTNLILYKNGVSVASGSNTYTGASWTTPFYVGRYYATSGYNLNGLIDELVILSRAADADEIRAIYESNAPVFAESSTNFFKSYGPTPVEINEEGLFVTSVTTGDIFAVYGGGATKSWGGLTLGDGDVMIGRNPDGYIHWDDSADTLSISGQFDVTGTSTISGVLRIDADDTPTAKLYIYDSGVTNTPYTFMVNTAGLYAGDSFDLTDVEGWPTFAVASESQGFGSSTGSFTMGVGDVFIGDAVGGANILWDQSAGQLLFRDATTTQLYIDTDGSLVAGGGSVKLNNLGIMLEGAVSSTYATQNAVRWGNASDEEIGSIRSFDTGTTTAILMQNHSITGKDGGSTIESRSPSGRSSTVTLRGWADSTQGGGLTLGLDNSGNKYVQIETGSTQYLRMVNNAVEINASTTIQEISSTPSNPTSGTQAKLYMKSDKLVIQYNDAGTVRYKYLDLTGTGVTWTHTTTAP